MFKVMEHTAEPVEGIIRSRVNNLSSVNKVVWDKVTILELAGDWNGIPGKCQGRGCTEIAKSLVAVSTFVDMDCQTRRCFKGIDMEVRRTEDLVPTLMYLATVPVTKGSAKFVGGTISESH